MRPQKCINNVYIHFFDCYSNIVQILSLFTSNPPFFCFLNQDQFIEGLSAFTL